MMYFSLHSVELFHVKFDCIAVIVPPLYGLCSFVVYFWCHSWLMACWLTDKTSLILNLVTCFSLLLPLPVLITVMW